MATVAASVAASGSAPAADSWTAQDQRRMLHVVFRVGDLKKSIEFYKTLGMDLLRERDVPDDKYTNAFLGFGPETSNFAIELTYNYGVESYDLGDAFGHFAVATTDVKALVEKVRAAGGKVSREPGPVKGGTSQTIIAFVEDPTGYKWELIERSNPSREPLAQVMLRVGDLEKSTSWYRDVLGMTVLRTRDNPDQKYTLGFAGYGPEEDNTVVELTYNYGRRSYENRGNAYGQIALSTDDVYKTAEAVRAAGGKVTKEPGPLPGLGTKIMACTDPDGWKYVFVDNKDFLAELK